MKRHVDRPGASRAFAGPDAAAVPGRRTLAGQLGDAAPAAPRTAAVSRAPVVQRTPEQALHRLEELLGFNPNPTVHRLIELVQPMSSDERAAVIPEIERRLGAEIAERVRIGVAGRVAPFSVPGAAITHADDDPARLADLSLRDVAAVYAMRGRAIGDRATGFHRAPSGAVFSYEWVHGDAGTAILRGEIRSRLVPGVTEAQRTEYRAQIAAIDGAPARLAEVGAMIDEAAARTAEGHAGTAPALVDVGRQGRTYSRRGESRVDGADMSSRIHAAMDVPGPAGTGVYAPAAGQVVSSGMVRGYGNLVTLLHEHLPAPYEGRRFHTAYAHMSQRLVETGGSVSAGQAVGLVGNTRTDSEGDGGRVASGMAPHLHFGLIELFGGAAPAAWSSPAEERYARRRDHIRPDDWLAQLGTRIAEAPYETSGGGSGGDDGGSHRGGARGDDAPVQPLAEGDALRGGASILDTARSGVAGGGGALPHLDAIQASFGEHDVSAIRAHVGGAAGGAAQAIGARAYATGDAIAFRGAPDLHEAAHEAAHVVQQRAGVDVAGGVGRTGDRYEQHADAVADAVVRGESAQPLLDQFGGSSAAGSAAGAAVQRTPEEALRRFEELLERSPHPTTPQLRGLLEPMPSADRRAVLSAIDDRLGHHVGDELRTALAAPVAPFAVESAPEITRADDDVSRLAGVELRDIFALYAMRGHAIGDRATGFHRAPNGATFSYEWVHGGAGTAALRNLIRTRLRALPAAQRPGLVADLDYIDGAADRVSELRALVADTAAPAAGEDPAAPPGITAEQIAQAVADDTAMHLRIDWVRRLQTRLRADGHMTSLDGAFDTATVIGVMWFQHDAGLPVDGRITAETRQRIEAGFTDMHDGLLGDHLAPRLLVPGAATGAERYDYYRGIVTAAGGVFLDGPRDITMLGIRGVHVEGEPGHLEIRQTDSAAGFAAAREAAGDPLPGASVPEGTAPDRRHFSGRTRRDHGFDDVIITLWYELGASGERVYHVSEHRGSVDPQSHWHDSRPSEGTSHLRDGTYRYELATHTTDYDRHRTAVAGFEGDPTMEYSEGDGETSYAALIPTDDVEVWRDGARDDDHFLTSAEEARSEAEIAERDPRYTSGPGIGIHIHSAPNTAPSSQGCQNVPVGAGYRDMIHEIAGSANSGGVYYTLIDASRIAGELVIERSEPMSAPAPGPAAEAAPAPAP